MTNIYRSKVMSFKSYCVRTHTHTHTHTHTLDRLLYVDY